MIRAAGEWLAAHALALLLVFVLGGLVWSCYLLQRDRHRERDRRRGLRLLPDDHPQRRDRSDECKRRR